MEKPSDFDMKCLGIVLSSYNDSNRHSNRLWATCAAMTILIISGGLGDESITLFASEFKRDYFLPIATITLSMVNIAYCVAHSAAYRVGQVYHSLINERFSELNFTTNYPWKDTAHRLAISNFNRIFPLLHKIEILYGKKWYKRAKFLSDILFSSIPVFGILFGVLSYRSVLTFLVAPFACASIFCTALLFSNIREWIETIVDPQQPNQ